MISAFFHTFFYNPIYNLLVALVALVPGGDVGIAVVVLTIIIRLILLPFSLSAARTQRAMRALEPKLAELKEKHKDNKEEHALKTLELYRTERVNPFASILTVFVQLPVLLGLYWVFYYEPFTVLNTALLYSFTPVPGTITDSLFGLVPLAEKSVVLAFLAGLTQYLQAQFALSNAPKPTGTGMQADFSRVMAIQLRYVFPILIATVAYSTSAAIALYFVTTNTVGVLQEWYVRRQVSGVRDQVSGVSN
ncbi:MAG: YidC/Oxa1 family membrane protein insertase [bacterium]|nr:YidC/Oxa1 family membrane protein insertase [bacterium]